MVEAIRCTPRSWGERPRGWYTGRTSMNTVRLAAEEGGFAYVADSYADDLPYWMRFGGRDQLIVPYTLDANDMRFATPQGFNSGDQFEAYLKDSSTRSTPEGQAGAPKMMSIGLHCRLVGRPGRAAALKRALDYMRAHDGVWFATRLGDRRALGGDPSARCAARPSEMDREAFVSAFGGIFEHSPWIAERAFDAGAWPTHDTAAACIPR
jgi:hypothetical protein